MELATCSGSIPGQSEEEITKLRAATTRQHMHRLLAWATVGWHSRSPQSTIPRSIKWTYSQPCCKLTWRKISIRIHCRDVYVWSKLEADTAIQDQRLCGIWSSAWESVFMACKSLRMFGMAHWRTSLAQLGLWHHASTGDCSCSMRRRIMPQFSPQLFCTWMISLLLLMRVWLGRSRIRWRRGSRCMITGVSPAISAWTSKWIGIIRRWTSIS